MAAHHGAGPLEGLNLTDVHGIDGVRGVALHSRLAAMASSAVREHMAREEASVLDYLGIVRLGALLGDAPLTTEALVAALDDYHCNRGKPPMAVLATAAQVSLLRASILLAEYIDAPRLDRFPDGIPGHRLVATFYGVPLFVPEGA